MKKILTNLQLLSIPAVLFFGAGTANADEVTTDGELTGTITATSNYIWRGQEGASAALQTGVNYKDKSGVYGGAWTTNLYTGNELDLYVGYGGAVGEIKYDVGFMTYQFPQTSSASFEEIYAGISQGAFAAKFSTSSDEGDYIEVSAALPVKRWEMLVHFGHYSRDILEDYVDYGVTFSKDMQGYDMHFMISDTDLPGDQYRTVVSVSKSFQP